MHHDIKILNLLYMSKVWKPTPIRMIYPVMQKSESVKSECSTDEHFSFMETLRA
jgi:hypothetical protein